MVLLGRGPKLVERLSHVPLLEVPLYTNTVNTVQATMVFICCRLLLCW